MNRNDLFRGFQEIDDKLLERSEMKKAKVVYVWKKWAALAACICMLVVAIPYVRNIIFPKGNGDSQIDVPEIALCYYQGALYECCNNKDGLDINLLNNARAALEDVLVSLDKNIDEYYDNVYRPLILDI